MIVSIRMNDKESKLAEAYAKLKGRDLEELIKYTFFERIEDEHDIALTDEAIEEYEKNPKAYSLEEIKKELGLWKITLCLFSWFKAYSIKL